MWLWTRVALACRSFDVLQGNENPADTITQAWPGRKIREWSEPVGHGCSSSRFDYYRMRRAINKQRVGDRYTPEVEGSKGEKAKESERIWTRR